jgi:hypothetical protein
LSSWNSCRGSFSARPRYDAFDGDRVDHQIPDLDAPARAERRHPPVELRMRA